MRFGRVMACSALLAALLLAGCGGDDGGAADPAAAAGDPSAPVSGVEAEPPRKVKSCLERAGLTVETQGAGDGVAGATGITDQLSVISASGGAGSIVYFETEEQAITAHQAELDNQEPGSVIARKGAAYYVYAGDDMQAGGAAIRGCL